MGIYPVGKHGSVRDGEEVRAKACQAEAEGWASALSRVGVCGFAALLPWHAFGAHELRSYVLLEPVLWPLLLSAPAIGVLVWRERRRVLRSPALLLALAALWLGPLSRLHRFAGLGELWLEVAPGWSLLAVYVVVARGHLRAVLRALVWSGAAALGVSLVGWAIAVALGQTRGAFVYASAHPLFPSVPRLTGTFGSHAVWLGEYCVALLAASWAMQSEPFVQRSLESEAQEGSRALAWLLARDAEVARWAGRLAGVGLLLSFSFAWVGGGLLLGLRVCARWFRRRRAGWVVLWLVWTPLFVVASWMLVVGLPAPAAGSQPAPCADFDRSHHVLRRLGQGQCQPMFSQWPYRHRTTLYALAHETTLEVVREQPWLGMRESERDRFAVRYARQTRGLGTRGYYTGPIGLWAGTLSRGGVLSLLALVLACFFTCWGRWSRRSAASTKLSALGASAREQDCKPGSRALAWSPWGWSSRGWCFWGWVASLATLTQTDWVLTGPVLLLWGCVLTRTSHSPSY